MEYKYTKNDFLEYGYKIIGDGTNKATDKIWALNSDGYKVLIDIKQLKEGRNSCEFGRFADLEYNFSLLCKTGDCEYVGSEYKVRQKNSVKLQCGHIEDISNKNLKSKIKAYKKNGSVIQCSKCREINGNALTVRTKEKVAELIDSIGCKLLRIEKSSNKNYSHRVIYIGKCGHEIYRSQGNIKNSRFPDLCGECAKKVKKQNNHAYFSEDTLERDKDKLSKIDATLYIVKLRDENESFYKIGLTKDKVYRRLSHVPYDKLYEEMYVISGNLYDIAKLEKELHDINKVNAYEPNIKFGGYTECFSIINKKTMGKIIEKGGVLYGN